MELNDLYIDEIMAIFNCLEYVKNDKRFETLKVWEKNAIILAQKKIEAILE